VAEEPRIASNCSSCRLTPQILILTNGSEKRQNDNIARVVPRRPGYLFKIAERALCVLRATPEKIRHSSQTPSLAYIWRAYA
jgi:hypothetical protein